MSFASHAPPPPHSLMGVIDVVLSRPGEAETPLSVYEAALRRTAQGRDGVIHIVNETGGRMGRIDASSWTARYGRATTGCSPAAPGPQWTSAAARPAHRRTDPAGQPALGIDISAEAVRQARRRGAPAMCRDVFEPVPGAGRWRTVLLADGNIGIGGDPAASCAAAVELLGRRRHGARRTGRRPGARPGPGHVRCATANDRARRSPGPASPPTTSPHVAARGDLRVLEILDGGRPMVRQPDLGDRLLRRPLPAPPDGAATRPFRAGRSRPALRSTPADQPARLALGVAFARLFRHRAAQPPHPAPTRAGSGGRPAGRAVPGDPGPARRHRAWPRCRCSGPSCGRSTRSCSPGRRSATSPTRWNG